MKLSKDDVIRMKFSIMKAAILPIDITDQYTLNNLSYLSKIESYDKAYAVLEEHIKKLVRFDKIIVKRYPQVIRNVLRDNIVNIGFEIEDSACLNRIKITNSELTEKIKQYYDIRI